MSHGAQDAADCRQPWRGSVTDVVAARTDAVLSRVREELDQALPRLSSLRSLTEVIDTVATASAAAERSARDSLSAAAFDMYADLTRLERVLQSARANKQTRALVAAAAALESCGASGTTAEVLEAGDNGVETLALESAVSGETGAWQVLDPPTNAKQKGRESTGSEDDGFERALLALYRASFTCAVDRALLLGRLEALRAELTTTSFSRGTSLAALASTEDAPLASASRNTDLASLTRRERQVLDLLAEGCSSVAIARRLVISDSTVKTHVKGILRKLGAANRTEAVARWHQLSAR